MQLQLVDPEQGEVTTRTVVFPFTPPSKNVYDNWQPLWKRSHREKWARHLRVAAQQQQFPIARRVAASAQLIFPSKARRDAHNYLYPLWHVVPDVLVDLGVIPDDTPDHFTLGPNGGISFGLDDRIFEPKEKRHRTILGLAFEQ